MAFAKSLAPVFVPLCTCVFKDAAAETYFYEIDTAVVNFPLGGRCFAKVDGTTIVTTGITVGMTSLAFFKASFSFIKASV